MRKWKIAFAAVAVAVLVTTFIVLRQSDFLLGGTAGAATPSPAAPAMPVPVARIVKKDDPDLPGLFGADGVDPQHHAPGQGPRLYPGSSTSRTAPTSRKATSSTRSIRAIYRPHSTRPRRRCNATRQRSTMRSRISIADRRSPRAATSPRTLSTSAPAPSARPKQRSRWIGPQSDGRAQSRLYGNPRAVRRPPRSEPGAGRHAGQRRRRTIEHAGAARSDLRHLQSRARRTSSRSRRRGRAARSTPTFFCRARPRRATRAS